MDQDYINYSAGYPAKISGGRISGQFSIRCNPSCKQRSRKVLEPHLRLFRGGFSSHTICPRSNDPFYIASKYVKWETTSWTFSCSRCIHFLLSSSILSPRKFISLLLRGAGPGLWEKPPVCLYLIPILHHSLLFSPFFYRFSLSLFPFIFL